MQIASNLQSAEFAQTKVKVIDTSTFEGHFVLSPRKMEKKDKRDSSSIRWQPNTTDS